jgi:hypothetical protein
MQFSEAALEKFPAHFKRMGQQGRLFYSYKKGWRSVDPVTDNVAKIQGFDVFVDISGAKVKRAKTFTYEP